MAGSVTKLGALAICQTCQLSELTGSTGARRCWWPICAQHC